MAESTDLQQISADLHDIATCLKLLVAQSLSTPGLPPFEMVSRLFGEGLYYEAQRLMDSGPDNLRAVA